LGRRTNKYQIQKEAISLSPLFILKNMVCPQNKVNYQEHDHSDATMPEEAHHKVKDTHYDVKEKAEDHEHDH